MDGSRYDEEDAKAFARDRDAVQKRAIIDPRTGKFCGATEEENWVDGGTRVLPDGAILVEGEARNLSPGLGDFKPSEEAMEEKSKGHRAFEAYRDSTGQGRTLEIEVEWSELTNKTRHAWEAAAQASASIDTVTATQYRLALEYQTSDRSRRVSDAETARARAIQLLGAVSLSIGRAYKLAQDNQPFHAQAVMETSVLPACVGIVGDLATAVALDRVGDNPLLVPVDSEDANVQRLKNGIEVIMKEQRDYLGKTARGSLQALLDGEEVCEQFEGFDSGVIDDE